LDELIEFLLPGMPEWWMAQVMGEGSSFGNIWKIRSLLRKNFIFYE
jgi:hypothetical protein